MDMTESVATQRLADPDCLPVPAGVEHHYEVTISVIRTHASGHLIQLRCTCSISKETHTDQWLALERAAHHVRAHRRQLKR